MGGSRSAAAGAAGPSTVADGRCGGGGDGGGDGETSSSSLQLLPPAVLAAVAERLPAPDLLRLGLASRATRDALGTLPRLYSTAAACALGWPPPQPSRQPPRQQGDATLPPACAAADGGAEAACRELLSAAAVLAAAGAQHRLRPQARTPPPPIAAAIGRGGKFERRDAAGLSPPLVLTWQQQALLTLGGQGVYATACASCPRGGRPGAACGWAVAVEVGGQITAELYLPPQPGPPLHPGWARLAAAAPADAGAGGALVSSDTGSVLSGGGGSAVEEEEGEAEEASAHFAGSGSAAAGDAGLGAAGAAAPFELYLSERVDAGQAVACALAPSQRSQQQQQQQQQARGGGRGGGRGAPAPPPVPWGEVRAAVMRAVSGNAARARAARCTAVLHPGGMPAACASAEASLRRLSDLGYPVLDLRTLFAGPSGRGSGGGGGSGSSSSSSSGGAGGGCSGGEEVGGNHGGGAHGTAAPAWPPGSAGDEARRRWRMACAMVREEAQQGLAGQLGPMPSQTAAAAVPAAQLQAVSAALSRAVGSLPHAAPAVRVVVVPLLVPRSGRVGHAQPGRGAQGSIAAPQLLSAMAPVLGTLRTVMPTLPHLQQVVLMCPPAAGTGAEGGGRGGGGGAAGRGAGFTLGVARALAASCMDR